MGGSFAGAGAPWAGAAIGGVSPGFGARSAAGGWRRAGCAIGLRFGFATAGLGIGLWSRWGGFGGAGRAGSIVGAVAMSAGSAWIEGASAPSRSRLIGGGGCGTGG